MKSYLNFLYEAQQARGSSGSTVELPNMQYEKWVVSAMARHSRQLLQVYFRKWVWADMPPLMSLSDEGPHGMDDEVDDEADRY